MESLFSEPFKESIEMFVQNHAVLWFALVIVGVLFLIFKFFADMIPQYEVMKSRVLLPIARRFKHAKLVKAAIKSDIRGHVNDEISKIKNYFPTGWTNEMDLEWVSEEDPTVTRSEGKMIIRIRPVEDQDTNFVNATYHYIKSSFFPKTQAVIPKPHYDASVLFVCRKIVSHRGAKARSIFEDEILEPAIQRHTKITQHLDDYSLLDERGFFSGTFLRELHLVATDARFSSQRNEIPQEASSVIKHIKRFIEAFKKEDVSPKDWYNHGSISKYAILLVAHPLKAKSGIDGYINRARGRFSEGAKRLYVFGSNSERAFAASVIKGIEDFVDGVRLVDKFETLRDYRGDKGGLGAVFEVDYKVDSEQDGK